VTAAQLGVAGDHGSTGVHGAALGGVVGDRISQFGIFVVFEHEASVGPPAQAGARVGVQGAPDEQPFPGDNLDAEQVAVGQGAPGFPGLDGVVVAGADDQVAGTGLGAIGDADGGSVADDAEGDEVVADAAVQLVPQGVAGGHEYRGVAQQERGARATIAVDISGGG
jgi:hypothetical protein